MPLAIQDNASSCRSSPIHWNPTPVPAPAFEGFPALTVTEENVSWEHCIRILNNSGRSFPRSSTTPYPVFGSERQMKRSSTIGGYVVQSPESPLPSEFSDFPTNKDFESKDFERSPQPSPQHNSSILKKIFGIGGKNLLSRSSSISSLSRSEDTHFATGKQQKKHAKSPQPRLSSVGLTGDADPRVSSTNLATDGALFCQGELCARNMRRWLQQQQWTAMAAKAESNLNELLSMLDYVMTSLGDMREMENVAEEMQQRRSHRYYAS